MWATAPMATIAALLVATPCQALDAMRADIIGLRLGMTDSDVTASLQHQGFAVTSGHATLTAKTLDGQLTVDLTDDHVVRQIRYTLAGRGAGETNKIEASVLDHFGPPNQAMPMAWCRTLGRDGKCMQDGATLTFSPGTLTLVLRNGATTGK